jgi:YegS/Rv2252/BmrU family lipid kinase
LNGFNASTAVAIVNPRAGKGGPAYLPQGVEILRTEASGHATALAREALKRGVKTIIAVGGDGTINEIVNGFFEDEQPIPTDAAIAVIPHGTGSDFSRILNLPLDRKLAATVIPNGQKRLIDVMKVRYIARNETKAVRYAINVTSFGMGGEVADRVNRSMKPFGAFFAFLSATLQTALTFSGRSVALHLDDLKTMNARITNVAAGNGQYHGAGMWICPGALIDDGLLDVTVVRHLRLHQLIRNIPVLYNGGIYSHPKVESYRVKNLRAESAEKVLLEIDGEPLGRLPVEISIVPNAIRVFFQ